MNSLLISLEDVSLSVPNPAGRRNLLNNVYLRLDSGFLLPLIGPSDCEKSTLLRTIVRLSPRVNGNIFFSGKPLEKQNPPDIDAKCISLLQYPIHTVAFCIIMHHYIVAFCIITIIRRAAKTSHPEY